MEELGSLALASQICVTTRPHWAAHALVLLYWKEVFSRWYHWYCVGGEARIKLEVVYDGSIRTLLTSAFVRCSRLSRYNLLLQQA